MDIKVGTEVTVNDYGYGANPKIPEGTKGVVVMREIVDQAVDIYLVEFPTGETFFYFEGEVDV